MRNSSLLTVLSAVLLSMATLESSYGMSFGNHHNGGGPGNQNMSQGNGRNANVHDSAPYGDSLDARGYPLPVPEPASIVLLASGLLGVGLWRWRDNRYRLK
jgi:hypothetical protein